MLSVSNLLQGLQTSQISTGIANEAEESDLLPSETNDGVRLDRTFRRGTLPLSPAYLPGLLPALSGINVKELDGWQASKVSWPCAPGLPDGLPGSPEDALAALVSQQLDEPTWHALQVHPIQ